YLQQGRAYREGDRAGGEAPRPTGVSRCRALGQAEPCVGRGAGQAAARCRRGEARPLLEGETPAFWPGGQRQTDEPAADRLAPAPPGKARRADQQWRDDQLEEQRVHRSFGG